MATMINAVTGQRFEAEDDKVIVYLRRGHMLAAEPLDTESAEEEETNESED